MLVACKNCGTHFTEHEMATRRPPMHPWQLTPVGARVLQENETAGDRRPCPQCGNFPVRGASGSTPPSSRP